MIRISVIRNIIIITVSLIIYNFSIDRMGMGGMGITQTGIQWEWEFQKIGNGDGREWELNRWEWEGM